MRKALLSASAIAGTLTVGLLANSSVLGYFAHRGHL